MAVSGFIGNAGYGIVTNVCINSHEKRVTFDLIVYEDSTKKHILFDRHINLHVLYSPINVVGVVETIPADTEKSGLSDGLYIYGDEVYQVINGRWCLFCANEYQPVCCGDLWWQVRDNKLHAARRNDLWLPEDFDNYFSVGALSAENMNPTKAAYAVLKRFPAFASLGDL